MSDAQRDNTFSGWALVEVMGHQRYAGMVGEAVVGGASFVRVDTPAIGGRPAFTKLLGAGAIFAITPLTEEAALRAAAACYAPPPVPYMLKCERECGEAAIAYAKAYELWQEKVL